VARTSRHSGVQIDALARQTEREQVVGIREPLQRSG
jgi:hypothetical protein